jgi:hypothetical protein
MAEWNTPARNAAIIKRPFDQAENAAQRLVSPEPSEVGGEVRDTDGGILERGPEPRLAVGKSAPACDLFGYHFAE